MFDFIDALENLANGIKMPGFNVKDQNGKPIGMLIYLKDQYVFCSQSERTITGETMLKIGRKIVELNRELEG